MKKHLTLLLALLLFSTVAVAYEEVVFSLSESRARGSIRFSSPAEAEIGIFSDLSNKTYKPQGDGPFPAVVLIHTCGGLRNPHIKEHAQFLLTKGYVVLIQDSFTPRGLDYCRPGSMLPARIGVMDAYDALEHLRTFRFVDKEKIFQAGFSWGAVIAQFLSSTSVAEKLEAKHRFKSTVSFYGTCFFNNLVFARPDADQPVLMLIAGKDREQNLDGCAEYLQSTKTKGSKYEWFTYADASHGWDKKGESRLGYIFDPAITSDSLQRMLEFFDRSR